jgi:Phytanoyl-CoA dioxygenase (PhyH)
MTSSQQQRRAPLQEFERQGFLSVPGALTPAQITAFNREIDDYLRKFPQEWVHFDASLVQTVNVLPRTSAFDAAIENTLTLDLLRGLLGDEISFEEFSIMIRYPTTRTTDIKSWHRDITRDYERRKEINAISLIYYLTDVTETDHCFSIIPETHNRLVDFRPGDVAPGMERDLLGPAGTAVLFHARCLHSGKLKPTSRERRTLHLYYSHSERARTSEWSDIPERLHRKHDPTLPARLYSKWNRTDVFEGTGKKPKDLDPAMSAADMIREVQRRANQKS